MYAYITDANAQIDFANSELSGTRYLRPVNALYAEDTGDDTARERAVGSLNYATYFTDGRGRVACCGDDFPNAYWFDDGYADYTRSFSWAMAALPELAPQGQDHLLGSSSVVKRVSYGRRSVGYRAFDRTGTERLD